MACPSLIASDLFEHVLQVLSFVHFALLKLQLHLSMKLVSLRVQNRPILVPLFPNLQERKSAFKHFLAVVELFEFPEGVGAGLQLLGNLDGRRRLGYWFALAVEVGLPVRVAQLDLLFVNVLNHIYCCPF